MAVSVVNGVSQGIFIASAVTFLVAFVWWAIAKDDPEMETGPSPRIKKLRSRLMTAIVVALVVGALAYVLAARTDTGHRCVVAHGNRVCR